MSELEEFLNDEPVTEEPESEPEQEPVAAEAEAEAGEDQEPEKEPEPEEQEDTGEEDASPASQETSVPLSALHGERDRRQQAERELAALREQVAKPKEPDPYEDPEGFEKFREQQSLEQQQQQSAQRFNQEMLNQRITLTETLAREIHKDYDEVKDVFVQAAEKNPSLVVGLRTAENPAAFAYEQGQRIKALQEIGNDPNAYREKVRQEVLAELKKGKAQETTLPNHLADSRSVSDRKGPEWSGPEDLGEILPGLD